MRVRAERACGTLHVCEGGTVLRHKPLGFWVVIGTIVWGVVILMMVWTR
jgi:hypothetical protein